MRPTATHAQRRNVLALPALELDRFMLAFRAFVPTPEYRSLAGIHGGGWEPKDAPALVKHAHRDYGERDLLSNRWVSDNASAVAESIGDYAFCHHGSPLFLGWHRPFVAEFEATLRKHDPFAEPGRSSIPPPLPSEAAPSPSSVPLALHYWRWDDGWESLPALFTAEEYKLQTQPGREAAGGVDAIPNPFHPDNWTPKAGSWEAEAKATNKGRRAPIPPQKELNKWCEKEGLPQMDFASKVPQGVDAFNYLAATSLLEDPHGTIHNAVGGQMGESALAAFDPIFWLHHSNVERQFVLWQNARVAEGYSVAPAPVASAWYHGGEDGSNKRHLCPFGRPSDVAADRFSFTDENVTTTMDDWWCNPASYDTAASQRFGGTRGVALRAPNWLLRLRFGGKQTAGTGTVTLTVPRPFCEDVTSDSVEAPSTWTLPFSLFTSRGSGCPGCQRSHEEVWVSLGTLAASVPSADLLREAAVTATFNGAAVNVLEWELVDEATSAAEQRGATFAADLEVPDLSGFRKMFDKTTDADLAGVCHCRGKSHTFTRSCFDAESKALRMKFAVCGDCATASADFKAALRWALDWWSSAVGDLAALSIVCDADDANVAVCLDSLGGFGRVSAFTSHARNPEGESRSTLHLYVDRNVREPRELKRWLRHLIGHALGLGHSGDPCSVMAPFRVPDSDPKNTHGDGGDVHVKDHDRRALVEMLAIFGEGRGDSCDIDERMGDRVFGEGGGDRPKTLSEQRRCPQTGVTCPLCGEKFVSVENAARHVAASHCGGPGNVSGADEFIRDARAKRGGTASVVP